MQTILEGIAALCILEGVLCLIWAFFESFPDWDQLREDNEIK